LYIFSFSAAACLPGFAFETVQILYIGTENRYNEKNFVEFCRISIFFQKGVL